MMFLQMGLILIEKFRQFFILFSLSILLCTTAPTLSAERVQEHNDRQSLFPKKLVIAHYMTDINAFHRNWRIDPAYFRPDGPAKVIGGGSQYIALLPLIHMQRGMTQEEMVEHEIRSAMAMGIDGFHFYYILWPQGADARGEYPWHDIIRTFFKVCDEKNLDFKLTLCLSHPGGDMNEETKTDLWAKQIQHLLKDVGDSEHWLRTRDGRIAFMSWHADPLSDAVQHNAGMLWTKDISQTMASIRGAYDKLFSKMGIDALLIYHLIEYANHPETTEFKANFAEYVRACDREFEIVTGFVPTLSTIEADRKWTAITNQLRRGNHTEYVQAAYFDFYDSKVFDREHGRLLNSPQEVNEADVSQVKKHFIPVRGTSNFRKSLERAIDWDASLITITTWNDYPEGHHFAPSVDHGFVPSLLLQYYKAKWLNKKSEEYQNIAMVSYRKYEWQAKPTLFEIPLHSRQAQLSSERLHELMDVIEVVTILDQRAKVYVNGRMVKRVESGIQSCYVRLSEGPVKVDVVLDDGETINLRPSEWITDLPYRTDRSLVCWSSERDTYSQLIFGSRAELPMLNEYEIRDGQANWEREYRLNDVVKD